jgi:hypothetical protein
MRCSNSGTVELPSLFIKEGGHAIVAEKENNGKGMGV